MKTQETARSLITAMGAEIACFEAYVAAQRSFSASLRDRDWGSLETAMRIQDELAAALGECERVRAETFETLRAGLDSGEEGLYRVALRVQEPERSELTDAFRRLKISAMRAKFENAWANDFAAGNRDLLRAVLEELFPEKKGRIYGRSGRTVQPGLDSVLLNTAL